MCLLAVRLALFAGVYAVAAAESHLEVKSYSDKQSPRQSSLGNSKPWNPSDENSTVIGAQAGAIKINEDGVWKTYYLPGATTMDDDTTLRLTPPWRFYLMKTPTTNFGNADAYYKPKFPGKTFTVDINFGQQGASCGCNINFYLVDGPVSSKGKDNDYYCDAQCFPGLGCCAEFDMNEGNALVQQATNHACTHDYQDHTDWQCHKWGAPLAKTTMSQFGPGSNNIIDSTKTFTYSQAFHVEGSSLNIITTISQGARNITLPMQSSSQLGAMLDILNKGMVFVTGYWFSDYMNWMDGDVCGQGKETCNSKPATISNWRLTTIGPKDDKTSATTSTPVPTSTPVATPTPSTTSGPTPTVAPNSTTTLATTYGPSGMLCCAQDCTCTYTSGHEGPWCSASQAHCDQCGGRFCHAV